MADQSVAARNQRLDALETAVAFWSDKKRAEITKRVESSKKILRGRQFTQAAVQAASVLVVDSLNDFLLAQ